MSGAEGWGSSPLEILGYIVRHRPRKCSCIFSTPLSFLILFEPFELMVNPIITSAGEKGGGMLKMKGIPSKNF